MEEIVIIFGYIAAIAAGIGAIIALYKYITGAHDRAQKWDSYDSQIKDIKEEQAVLADCMYATLDGLHQLGCNGKVTKQLNTMQTYINNKAHGLTDGSSN